jgi:DNA mismatch repair protein MutL
MNVDLDRDGARIRVLPPQIADQIAAGEVVERPASVVKELVENSLDAGARRIAIDLEEAGTALIAVVDDGEGMSAADAQRAFARHATSKIACVEDLERIATLGFRGEALASIAAVSRTTLVTRRAADPHASCVVVEHGNIVEARDAGAPAGTRIEVAELFANTPARRKFLKAPSTEVGHVTELVTRTALAWPAVGFVLRHGKRTLLELAAVEDPAARVQQVFGAERGRAMLAFAGEGGAGHASGWLGDSHLTFPSPRQIYTYVNRRYVRDKVVSHALLAGYSTLLMHGRYPAAVVFLDVAFDEVDVNVHPAKHEVRFRRSGVVHELLAHAVRDRLRGHVPERSEAPASSPAPTQTRLVLREVSAERQALRELPAIGAWDRPRNAGVGDHVADATPEFAPHAGSNGFFGALRLVGQVLGGYLVCEGADAMVLIDQHAAHERVMFERLLAAYENGKVQQQQLLVPAVVDIGTEAASLLAEQTEAVARLGFEIEPYGGSSFAVRAVPALIGDRDPAAVVRDLAEDIVEFGRSRRIADAAHDVLARLACHSAVRLGQELGPDRVRALLRSMDGADFSGNCPHGRPAYIRVGRGELERWFKRT